MLHLDTWHFDDDGSKDAREELLRLLDWFLRPFENPDDGGVFHCKNEGVLLTGEVHTLYGKWFLKKIIRREIKTPILSVGLATDRHRGEKPMIHINTPEGVFFVYPEDYKGVIQKERLE